MTHRSMPPAWGETLPEQWRLPGNSYWALRRSRLSFLPVGARSRASSCAPAGVGRSHRDGQVEQLTQGLDVPSVRNRSHLLDLDGRLVEHLAADAVNSAATTPAPSCALQ